MFDILKRIKEDDLATAQKEERYGEYLKVANGNGKETLDNKSFFYLCNNLVGFVSCLLVLIANLFWLIQKIVGVSGSSSLLYILGLIIQLFGAFAYFFAVMLLPLNKGKFMGPFKTLYASTLMVGCVLIATSLIQDNNPNNLYVLYFYYFIICLMPSPSKLASFGIIGGMWICLFLPRIITSTSPMTEFILMIAFLVVYIAYRYLLVRIVLLENRLEMTGNTDSLTGSLNRRALDNYLSLVRIDTDHKHLAGIVFSIDDFRRYVEIYSHTEGDKLLNKVCSTIYNKSNKKTDYLFRYGGTEFIILIPDCSEYELLKKAKKLMKAISDEKLRRNDNEKNPFVTISMGLAITDIHDDIISELNRQIILAQRLGQGKIAMRNKIYAIEVEK